MPFPCPTTAHAQPQMQKVRKARKARKARKERKGRKGQREGRKGQRERQRAQLVAQRLRHASGRQRDRWSSALVSHGDPWRWGPRGRTTTGRAPREYRQSRRSRLVAAPVAAPPLPPPLLPPSPPSNTSVAPSPWTVGSAARPAAPMTMAAAHCPVAAPAGWRTRRRRHLPSACGSATARGSRASPSENLERRPG